MKLTYQFNSAQEVNQELLESIKATFKNKSIKILVESDEINSKHSDNNFSNGKTKNSQISKEMTDAVVEILFDQFLKKKKK